MTTNGIFQILVFIAVIWALAKPIGAFMAKVFAGERTWLHRLLRPVETAIYKLCGIDETAEQHWTAYAGALLVFSLVSLLFTYLIQRVQQWLPLNPQGLGNVAARPGLQHGGQFHHQHQLAVVHARNHHELPDPDGRAGHAQLLLRRGRHCRRDRARSAASRGTR